MEETTKGDGSSSSSRFASLKTLAAEFDADRSTVRRWLSEAGVRPIALSDGCRGAIRYDRSDVEQWLASRPKVH